MKNFIQDGHMMTVPAPYAVASGAGVLIGALFGIAAYAAPQGGSLEIATGGVFELPKAAGDTPALGQRIYWDNAGRAATTTAAGNTLIGIAADAALGGAASVRVRLNGFIQ